MLPVGRISDAATDIKIEDDEIVLEGKSVSTGYLNLKSNNFFKGKKYYGYKTGDNGYIKDGYLFCLGRKDNQIKYNGYRIELDEIESELSNLKEVKDCAVITKINSVSKVSAIIAFVVLNEQITEKKIKDKLAYKLPNYMVPKFIKITDKIPVNNNFKKDRKELMKNV
jgi:D-alanine--poly(phosphoribitol) ligase subunit 1